jgi:hypothetical protein
MTTNRTPENTDWEWFLQVVRTEPVPWCGRGFRSSCDRPLVLEEFDSPSWRKHLGCLLISTMTASQRRESNILDAPPICREAIHFF